VKRENKVWGERWLIRQDSTHTTNLLMLRSGNRCSWHSHKTKWNLFVVIEGSVGIVTVDGETRLGPGEEFTVAPGEMHEFRVHEDGMMIEEMYVEYDDTDIDRETVGGPMEKKKRRSS
jgi:mannose-6-phosphate isomerase-like protein (cupin superfamily)